MKKSSSQQSFAVLLPTPKVLFSQNILLINGSFRSRFLRLIPLLLRDCKMDLNETLGLYRVDPELIQDHRFNFRSEAQTGKIGIPEKYYMGLKWALRENSNFRFSVLDRKLKICPCKSSPETVSTLKVSSKSEL